MEHEQASPLSGAESWANYEDQSFEYTLLNQGTTKKRSSRIHGISQAKYLGIKKGFLGSQTIKKPAKDVGEPAGPLQGLQDSFKDQLY